MVQYKQQKRDPFAFSLIAQMVLDEALHNYYKAYYEREIDIALDTKDKERFMKLSAEYKAFLS
ncbi:IDEAL domain-containing protein [Fictibacillus sp. 5RED26]|nr:IDEAL domain-containing protein [Fictibacillus sp. 5RED26]MBH0164755.1 IDEAL domain-containing protein [Fictibacillus sp. 7GRE50]MBH0172643.1 IDEAL domain-containing protein [Fictibacillus sp. 23RED33]